MAGLPGFASHWWSLHLGAGCHIITGRCFKNVKRVTVNSGAQVVGTFWQFSPSLGFLFTTHLNCNNIKLLNTYVKEPCISQRVFVQSILKAPIPQRTVHLQYHPEYPAKNK